MSKKIYVAVVVVGVILGTFAFFGLTPFRAVSTQTIEKVFGATAQGATGNVGHEANIYGVNLATPGANATSSSILNPTGQDVYINAIKVGCERIGTSGAAGGGTGGLASLTFSVATTSTAAPAVQGAGTINAGTFAIGTSTPDFVMASSTAGLGNPSYTLIWQAGSYLTFFTNATNTAICSFSANYFQS